MPDILERLKNRIADSTGAVEFIGGDGGGGGSEATGGAGDEGQIKITEWIDAAGCAAGAIKRQSVIWFD